MASIEQQIKALYVQQAVKKCLDKLQDKRVRQASVTCGVIYMDEEETQEMEVEIILKRKVQHHGTPKVQI